MSERARLICPPCSGWSRTALAEAWAADCRACMAAARYELIRGRQDAARAYVQRARTHHRQAIAIRWRMRSWPR